MSHQAETELQQTYVLIWGESDNASSVKCLVCQVHGTGPHVALIRMLHPPYGCEILGAFHDVNCNRAGQDYGSFSTRNLHRTRPISAERDVYFGTIADTPFHVPAGS